MYRAKKANRPSTHFQRISLVLDDPSGFCAWRNYHTIRYILFKTIAHPSRSSLVLLSNNMSSVSTAASSDQSAVGGKGGSSVGNVFILKDSPPDLIDAASVKPQGRKYTKEIAESQPGSIKLDEVVLGMKYASLAITDDKEDTLKKVGKSNPWHIDALKIITGSEEEAHKPLTHILNTHMNLDVDAIIDVSGVTPGGHPLDTQGYIAHNDDVIVLAYRCTTSLKDWLTNLNTTSSEWEIEEDLAQGYSGFLSGLEGLCCNGGNYKPRVHTGFYNNFLATAPLIQKHIDPLLKADQPPRKLYVVGHSLGKHCMVYITCISAFIVAQNL